MSLILRLAGRFGPLIVRPSLPASIHPERPHPSSLWLRPLLAISWLAGTGLFLSLVGGQAWAQTDIEDTSEQGTIVAAGFGYQTGDESTITVKVYDAASGEVLSDEVYELNVNEGNSARSNPSQTRIFAGGVGLAARDLSDFMLRVYDAKTGKFQWEGRLNLTPPGGKGAGQPASVVVAKRATIAKIHATEGATQQPVFLLRALDAQTGGLVWEDEFSADGTGVANAQQIAAQLISLDGDATEALHTFDFRIRMIDHIGEAVLWEDQVTQHEAEESANETNADQAHMLPAWPHQLQQTSGPDAI
ncbi:MAG: hypothetical protein ACT4OL_13265 [Nitrospiraceae bacterium]